MCKESDVTRMKRCGMYAQMQNEVQRKLSACLCCPLERQKRPLNSLDMLTALKIVCSVPFCMMERQVWDSQEHRVTVLF